MSLQNVLINKRDYSYDYTAPFQLIKMYVVTLMTITIHIRISTK